MVVRSSSKFEKLIKSIDAMADRVSRATAEHIRSDVYERAPKSSGVLASSYTTEKVSHARYNVFTAEPYAWVVEFGYHGGSFKVYPARQGEMSFHIGRWPTWDPSGIQPDSKGFFRLKEYWWNGGNNRDPQPHVRPAADDVESWCSASVAALFEWIARL